MTDEPQRAAGARPDRLPDETSADEGSADETLADVTLAEETLAEEILTEDRSPAVTPADDRRPADTPAGDRRPADTSPDDRRPDTSRGDVVVSMRDVSRAFDKRTVVRGIDLTVFAGTILGVIGPSGAGKTTTIRMLTGALEPTSGEIEVLGQRPTSFRARIRERIGYMPQHFALYADLTARENIDFVASLFGLLWYRRRRRVREVLKLVQLWDARDTRAGRLSGGMQRRLELASALVHQPTLLILDEPTAGIDPILRVTVWEELHRLRDAGQTLLVTTQYVHEAEECDQVALIAHGRMIALATPDELRRSATGGDVVEVETTRIFEGSTVESVPGILAVRQLEARRFRVTVEDAARILPAIVDAVGAAGGDVASAREVRLTFDEVFAELVARAGDEDGAEEEAEVVAPDGRGTAA